MNTFFDLPIFGVFLTLAIYSLALGIRKLRKHVLLNPVLLSILGIILFLQLFQIDFESYNRGGSYISFFLGPSVVALGVFFYEKYEELKKNLKIFVLSVFAGGVAGVISVVLFLKLLQVPEILVRSLAAKSVTTPIAIEITKITSGLPEVTAGIVIAVGIFGNAFGPWFLRKTRIKSAIALGTALGTAAHGIGTARAFEESEIAGVYSGLAMCLNGIITALITPYFLEWML